jgi:hypothetical protein
LDLLLKAKFAQTKICIRCALEQKSCMIFHHKYITDFILLFWWVDLLTCWYAIYNTTFHKSCSHLLSILQML